MLLYSKYHAALVVLLTWLAGLFVDRSVPYFPIEISRTGAGPVSNQVFKWGALSIIASLWWENKIQWPSVHLVESPILVWACIVVAAWFPDETHFFIHAVAVCAMVACVVFNVVLVGDMQRRLPIVLCAVGLEGTAILIKGFVVLFTEFDNSLFDFWIYWKAIFNVGGLRDEIVLHSMNIMFKGVDYAIVPQLTVPVLRVTGVMQWIAFYLMMCLY